MNAPAMLPSTSRGPTKPVTIVPTLSFSLPSPEEEEATGFPSGSPAGRTSSPSRRYGPPSVGGDDDHETLPLMIREEDEDEDEDDYDCDDERTDGSDVPLLSTKKHKRSGSGVSRLPTSPLGSRRASAAVGCTSSPAGGPATDGLGSTIAEFLSKRKPEPEKPVATAVTLSSAAGGQPEDLLSMATQIVTGAVRQAQVRVKERARDCPGLRAMVSSFVAEVLDVAKREASLRLQEGGGGPHVTQTFEQSRGLPSVIGQGIRTNPWVNRAVRYFGAILDRICPCRSPFFKL